MFKKSFVVLLSLALTNPAMSAENSQTTVVCPFDDVTRCAVVTSGLVATSVTGFGVVANSVIESEILIDDVGDTEMDVVDRRKTLFDSNPKRISTSTVTEILDGAREGQQITLEYVPGPIEKQNIQLKYVEDLLEELELKKAEAILAKSKVSSTQFPKQLHKITYIEEQIEGLNKMKSDLLAGKYKFKDELKVIKVFNNSKKEDVGNFLKNLIKEDGKLAKVQSVPRHIAVRYDKAVARLNLFNKGKYKVFKGGNIAVAILAAITIEEATLGLISNKISQPSKSKLEMKSYNSNGSK